MKNKLKDYLIKSGLSNNDENALISFSNFVTHDTVYIDASWEILSRPNDYEYAYPSDFACLNGAELSVKTYDQFSSSAKLANCILLRDWNKEYNEINCQVPNLQNPHENKNGIDWCNKDFTDISIRPSMKLYCSDIIDARKSSEENFKLGFIQTPFGKTPCMEFGQFPQSAVTDANIILKLRKAYKDKVWLPSSSYAKPTGKKYIGRCETSHPFKLIYYPEYEYLGEKYVRVEARTADGDSKFSNGVSFNDGDVFWCHVEPIQWRITNWDDLPKEINPNGSGESDFINLRSEKALIAGIPFNHLGFSLNGQYWQNSMVRAYLNGYDIEKELQFGNGNIEYSLSENYDFTANNFISEAFGDIELTKDLTPAEEIINHSRRKRQSRYGVTIPKKSMSIEDQIKYYIDNRRPFMLHGKSGIGKSRRIADINPDFVSLTLRNGILPEEIIGKDTTDENGVSKWTPPSFYTELVKRCEENPNQNIVLFIDELTNVNEHEQSIIYDIVLNNSIKPNCGKLPDNCVVVAAGNSKDESEAAYNMPEPLFRRFHGHIYLPLNLESLLEWGTELRKDNGEQTNLHPLISSYLSTYEDALYTYYDPEKEGKNFVLDPRCWEQVSDIIYDNNGELWEELLANKIGEENTTRLLAFAEKNFITVEDILDENYDDEDIPSKLDEQYALALTLRHASDQEIGKVREFVARHLSGETLAKFDYAWINRDPERAMIIGELQKEQKDIVPTNNPPTEQSMTNKKIHIREFCNDFEDWTKAIDDSSIVSKSKKKAIVCNNVTEAKFLCKAFKALGKTWHNGSSYDETLWRTNTRCMSYTNFGTFGNSLQQGTYDFFDIDFEGVLDPKDIKYINFMFDSQQKYAEKNGR